MSTFYHNPRDSRPTHGYPTSIPRRHPVHILRASSPRCESWQISTRSCRYVSIENRFDPNIAVATQTLLGVTVSRIVADCDDGLNEPDSRWKETFEVYESKGRLYYIDRK